MRVAVVALTVLGGLALTGVIGTAMQGLAQERIHSAIEVKAAEHLRAIQEAVENLRQPVDYFADLFSLNWQTPELPANLARAELVDAILPPPVGSIWSVGRGRGDCRAARLGPQEHA